jgi:hypothetical protein
MDRAFGYHEDYLAELKEESLEVQDAVFAVAEMLEHSGPQWKRPSADTLKGSKYPTMKELRITVPDGEWRVACAFDPTRTATLPAGGSRPGTNRDRFYASLLWTADGRYADHLLKLQQKQGEERNKNGDPSRRSHGKPAS